MKRREILFSDEAIHQIYRFYDFHQDNFRRKRFDDIINEEYAPKIQPHPRGFTDIVHPYEAVLTDLQNYLGRTNWAVFDADRIILIYSDFRKFICTTRDVIIYEEKDVFVRGYECHSSHFHVLLAKSKKSHLGTHKQFRNLIERLKIKYPLITANVAQKPCKFVGRDNDWRFEKNNDSESRLLRFWRKFGVESVGPDPNSIKLEQKAPQERTQKC